MKPCACCARHVRLAAVICPFCAAMILAACKGPSHTDDSVTPPASAPRSMGTVYGGPPVPNNGRRVSIWVDPVDAAGSLPAEDDLFRSCNNSPGKTTITLGVSPKGEVTSASASDTTGYASGEAECLTSVLRRVTFKPGPVTVKVTIQVEYR